MKHFSSSLAHFPEFSREFHISRDCRERFGVADRIISLTGTALVVDMDSARHLADAMQSQGRMVSAADLLAMGLIDEIQHLLLQEYRARAGKDLFDGAEAFLRKVMGDVSYQETLHAFATRFPTVAVHKGQISVEDYFHGSTNGVRNAEVLLEEMLMLWLENRNPAFAPYRDLFDESVLEVAGVPYQGFMEHFVRFLDGEPGLLLAEGSLLQVLQAPAMAHPDSLEMQLRFIESHVLPVLPMAQNIVVRILHGRDHMAEEKKSLSAWFSDGFQEMGRPDFSDEEIRASIRDEHHPRSQGMSAEELASGMFYPEYEAYTSDREWMPRLVLMAKNAYVWLDQLSRHYGRNICHLDHVPDEELDKLRDWGITGLWLIGLWERSVASRTIKQRMGAADAVASAYSLMDYTIATDLGGQDAMNRLAHRAWLRGIRMGSDMVPNHFGIDSTWVVHHPDRFLSLDHPPYPGYTFHGPDLSPHQEVGIFLEDHYYNHSDAAVVFKRVDYRSGETSYIYHGNDGTTMPWNDTAQLDYSKEYVREVVIRTILDVCRQFPIVRFDAAMTLAKRHIQRLWFPLPGSGDGIPSRAGRGMTREEFDRMHPQEFWREVVDRAAVEAPDCLLLAEAFWMLEGYFVRTLGMHRVYNSAFMHMLRDEDNAKYRYLIKETLEFDPQILQRYVNFMNNPDEKTAVEQFGKGDKYFGVTIMLATLPGLPMIGHGQVEGYGEKYGMEYRRAKWDEQPDLGLIEHHARMVFPIFHKRYIFSAVEHFYLYDFVAPEGHVNENVFAYSNRCGDELAMMIYHNRHADASGWIRSSVGHLVKGQGIRVLSLAQTLGLSGAENEFLLMRDHISGHEFIRSGKQIQQEGLFVSLGSYQCQLLWNMRIVLDVDGTYSRVHHDLQGRGVDDIETLCNEQKHAPIIHLFCAAVAAALDAEEELAAEAAECFYEATELPPAAALAMRAQIVARLAECSAELEIDHASTAQVLRLAALLASWENVEPGFAWLDRWCLRRSLKNTLAHRAISSSDLDALLDAMDFVRQYPETLMEDLFIAEPARTAIGVNEWQEVEYFSREKFRAVSMMLALANAEIAYLPLWWKKADLAGYQVAKMLAEPEHGIAISLAPELASEPSADVDSLPLAEMEESPLATEEEI